MIKDYLGPRDTASPSETSDKAPNPLRQLQDQYAKFLTLCFEGYAEGKRCLFEDDPSSRYTCTTCQHREGSDFCRANFFLKRVVKLIAEYLASKMAPAGSPSADDANAPAVITQAHVDGFKAKGMAVGIETPLCPDLLWLVPENTGQDRVEITPEEMHFLLQTSDAFDGKVVEVRRGAHHQASDEAGAA